MKNFLKAYVVFFLFGIFVGLLYPAYISVWVPSIILMLCFAFVELFGFWGFRERWSEYRIGPHMWYTIPATSGWLGIHLGRGDVGDVLTYLGSAIS